MFYLAKFIYNELKWVYKICHRCSNVIIILTLLLVHLMHVLLYQLYFELST